MGILSILFEEYNPERLYEKTARYPNQDFDFTNKKKQLCNASFNEAIANLNKIIMASQDDRLKRALNKLVTKVKTVASMANDFYGKPVLNHSKGRTGSRFFFERMYTLTDFITNVVGALNTENNENMKALLDLQEVEIKNANILNQEMRNEFMLSLLLLAPCAAAVICVFQPQIAFLFLFMFFMLLASCTLAPAISTIHSGGQSLIIDKQLYISHEMQAVVELLPSTDSDLTKESGIQMANRGGN